MFLPDYVTLPSELNITFKAHTNYIVREGNSIELVLEVQGESAEDIMVTVIFTTITAESEWSIFLHGNMLCNVIFSVDFVYGLDCCHSSVADDDYNVSSENVTIPAYTREIKIPVEALRDTDCDGTEFIKATLNLMQQPPVKVNILSATAYIAIVDATGKAAAEYCVYSYIIYYIH